jgi:hypothetical protein
MPIVLLLFPMVLHPISEILNLRAEGFAGGKLGIHLGLVSFDYHSFQQKEDKVGF